MTRYCIQVTYTDGSQEYLNQGFSAALFSKADAKIKREFLMIGLEGDDDIQAICIVKAPKPARKARAAK